MAKISGLLVQRAWWRGKELYFYSAPQLSDPTNADIRQILISILTYAKIHGYNRLVISSYDNWHNTLEAIPEVYLNQREEYVFDLNLPDPHLAHNTRFKRNYKKAIRIHPTLVENSTEEGLSNLLHLLKTTHHIRLKKNYSDYKLFYLPYTDEHQLRKLIENKLGRIYEIRVENQVHAIHFNLEANHSVFALFMAYDEFAYQNGLAAYIIHTLTDHYQAKGFTRYNFGGISKEKNDQGLRIFKESIGAKAVELNGLTTNFLQYPHKLLNPILNFMRGIKKKTGIITTCLLRQCPFGILAKMAIGHLL